MTIDQLEEMVAYIREKQSETQSIEVKKAELGCPKNLYDSLSSFSNQDEGGTIIFGIDEKASFRVTGVYNAHDLQEKVKNQCQQMEPKVRATFTIHEIDGKTVVAAEIPSIPVEERPCYYPGKGPYGGSYIRVGAADEPMSAAKVYKYEAYRNDYQDELKPAPKANCDHLNQDELTVFLAEMKKNKPNAAMMGKDMLCEMIGLSHDGKVTLAAIMLFGLWPQLHYPMLDIAAVLVAGKEMGDVSKGGNRFMDNKRLQGTIPQMLDEAVAFVKRNSRTSTKVNGTARHDDYEYPETVIRELILNALIHRDYSRYAITQPVQLNMYDDRLEIINPGGLYGRLSPATLGKVRAAARNPVLASSMETLKLTENRYSGIPTVRRLLEESGMKEPDFHVTPDEFKVTIFKKQTE